MAERAKRLENKLMDNAGNAELHLVEVLSRRILGTGFPTLSALGVARISSAFCAKHAYTLQTQIMRTVQAADSTLLYTKDVHVCARHGSTD